MIQTTEFWIILSFALFVLTVRKPLLRALFGMLDQHSEEIEQRIQQARSLQEEAQHQLAEFQRKQRDVVEEGKMITERANITANAMRQQALQKLDESLVQYEANALARLQQIERRAAQTVQELAADVAIDAARLLIAENMLSAQQDQKLEHAITQLPQQLQ